MEKAHTDAEEGVRQGKEERAPVQLVEREHLLPHPEGESR